MPTANAHVKQEQKMILRELAPLEGGVIERVLGVVAEGEVFPSLVVRCLDGKTRTVTFLRDPEGNGPGFPEVVVNP